MAVEAGADRVRSDYFDACAFLSTGALVAFVACGFAFTAVPQLDVAVAQLFVSDGHQFTGDVTSMEFVRDGFKALYVAACAFAVAGAAMSFLRPRTRFGLGAAKCLFLLACLVVGAGCRRQSRAQGPVGPRASA